MIFVYSNAYFFLENDSENKREAVLTGLNGRPSKTGNMDGNIDINSMLFICFKVDRDIIYHKLNAQKIWQLKIHFS